MGDEPPIAETQAVEELQPKPKRRRSKKTAEPNATAAETSRVEAPPAQEAEQAAPPVKPARKRRAKASEPDSAAAIEEQVSLPAANNDTAADRI